MPKVLAVDDDRAVLHLISRVFDDTDTAVVRASTAEEALALVRTVKPDVILLDVLLPDGSGIEVYKQIAALDAKLPVIFVTAASDSETAIEAMKLGAYDYLRKPIDVHQLADLVERAAEVRRLMRHPIELEAKTHTVDADHLVGQSPAMLEVYKAIGQTAPQDLPVLIRGESGTGKELVARAIYHHSKRSSKTFLAINCAAIPENLLESELFGHEKGAFTGADNRRIGKFEQCSGGTIFLDEIGDMPPLLQSKMLRVLQDQTFERVGGSETLRTDVRVIAATNCDLERMIEKSEFREDLYYRLNGVTINLPPLRKRIGDIELLAKHFLTSLAQRMGKDIRAYSDDAMALLKQYAWPGNVREMQSVLKRAILRSSGQVILKDFLPPELRQSTKAEVSPNGEESSHLPVSDLGPLIEERLNSKTDSLYAEAVEAMESFLISRVLQYTDGNQSQASRILGITRGSLRKKISSLGIAIERNISVD